MQLISLNLIKNIFINDNSEFIFKSDKDLNYYFTNDNITYYNSKLKNALIIKNAKNINHKQLIQK